MSNQKTELNTLQSCMIGAASGLAEVLTTHPLFIMKTNVQQGLSIPFKLSSLYKGVGANALSLTPITSIQVGASQWMEQHFFAGQPTKLQKMGAAFFGGALASVISCPSEKIMTIQNNNNWSLIQSLREQVKRNGPKGLFSGQMATLWRDGGFSVCFLMVQPILKAYIDQSNKNETSSALIAGMASGVAATILTQPFDTIKTIQQSSSSPVGFFKTAQQLGMKALYKGSLSRGASVTLSITLMSMLKEQLESSCKKYNDDTSKLK
jgi:hypothetical protein